MRLHGVGVDIVDVARVTRLLARGGSFARRWFSDDEAARCRASEAPALAFARVLAAKEAAWKSLRIGWDAAVPWRCVLVGEQGVVWFEGEVAEVAARAGVARVTVTTSSVAEVAMAQAMAFGPEMPLVE
ncbi:4'-phosphopantetheinyl transferase superfamily protein [Tessaracoccus rhinocerotis]|uniref:4'-phosphopantetheinyl transferase superfamily protein n=1 Tax=Tessaracoccus rhinocerotis TaxID=1689449 RepID=A0A553K1R5_9ACTN|nr:4'-phosphopantetheinyl transferase superfamily protein [Tessaracoccus rhinocerotis]TRY18646.1 4'-phosphopantetheinyl transferase superfamily protein [Tessaracoccus rhinocerotis]